MAGLICSASNPTAQSLAANTAKTLIQLKAAANQRARVRKISFLFSAIPSATTFMTVRLLTQSAAPTGSSSITAGRVTPGSETVQTAVNGPGSSEPSNTAVIDTMIVRPQLGVDVALPLDSYIDIAGNAYFGVECTCGGALTTGVQAKIIWEE